MYNSKKKRQRSEISKQVEILNSALSIEEYHKQNHLLLKDEDEEIKQMLAESKGKNKVS